MENIKEKFNEAFKSIPKRKPEKMKAYLITDKQYTSESQVIVFATTAGKAKTKGMETNEFDEYYFTELTARRQNYFDKYSDTQRIPIKELLNRDWWFYCVSCGRVKINEDDIANGKAFIASNDDNYYTFVKGTVICRGCNDSLESEADNG